MLRKNISLIEKDLSYKVVGILYKVHRELGMYAREKQYGDLIESYLKNENINYCREEAISKTGNDINKADFVINKCIILELKAKPIITKNDYYQTKRYLEFKNIELGIIVNFRQKYIHPKRVLNAKSLVNSDIN